jgi:hypothetical protein
MPADARTRPAALTFAAVDSLLTESIEIALAWDDTVCLLGRTGPDE